MTHLTGLGPIRDRLEAALSGRYAIERELGTGGMATVYLADDPRHGRKVALKVLRPELAAVIGAERFLAEIKTTAALTHPNILPLHDSGAADSFLFYVMPYMEGESLRDRLDREKQLPMADAIRIAGEVAGALDYAHRHGVIHRDIKPENILLHDGRALVADFGIALAASKASGTRMTETGMSLGTPHYMSPEQAMGDRDLDARSDVYALGAVTYEMLTGEPPFTGPTAQAIVAKVMTSRPEPVATIRPTVPPGLEAAVLTALQKLPADRFATAAEFAAALTAGGPTVSRVAPVATNRWRLVAAALAVVVVALAGNALWLGRGDGATMPAVFDVGFPDSAAMAFAVNQRGFSVSSTGDFLVYTVKQDHSTILWHRSLVDGRARPIPGSLGGTVPRISPDGRRIVFRQANRVVVLPTEGGQSRTLVEGMEVLSAEWISATSLLVLDDDYKLLRWLDPDGGETSTTRISYCPSPQWLATQDQLLCGGGGSQYAFLINPRSGKQQMIRAQAVGTDDTTGPPLSGTDFRVVDDRYLIYLSPEADLRATTYDQSSQSVGRSVTLISGVRREPYTGVGQWTVTATGMLAYATGPDAEIGSMVKVRPGASPEPLPIDPAAFLRFDLSRDGKRFAAAVQGLGSQELRIHDLENGRSQVWLKARFVGQPLWSPDGSHLLVDLGDGTRKVVVRGSPSVAGPLDTLLILEHLSEFGAHLAGYPTERLAILGNQGKLVSTIDPTSLPTRLDTLVADAGFPSLSPDGHWLAHVDDRSGQLVVVPFPARDRRVVIASNYPEPLWLSSTVVTWWDAGGIWSRLALNPKTGEPIGRSERWWVDPRFADTPGQSHRPSHDGGIIYKQGPAQTSAPFIRVVPGWVAEMKRAVDGANRR